MKIFLGILGIYLLMSFLMTFIFKYISAKEKQSAEEKGEKYEDDGECSDAEFGFLWFITLPLLVIISIVQLVQLCGKGMDKLIDKIINKK